MPNHGYHFTVSPDEEWIATLPRVESARDSRLRVLHRRSGKVWDCPLSAWPFDGFPDCFSADSKQIVLPGRVADLDESMRALELTELPGGATREGTFLGSPTRLLRGPGGGRRDRVTVPQGGGEFGAVAWSENGTEYASRTEGQAKTSFLRVTPPGRSYVVDFSLLLDGDNKRLREGAAKLPSELGEMLTDSADDPAVVLLKQLAVSPDQKHLAAVATIYRGQVGFAGIPYGVLIPLDRGGYVAHPFARNVYGKILWSRDADAIYYYAQSRAGLGGGTVHRLALRGMRFSGATTDEPAEVPRPLLEAPSDAELQRQRSERIKRKHYAELRALFSKPQTLLEFESKWGFTESGHVVTLYGVALRTREELAQLERTLEEDLVGRALRFELPDEKDFLRHYNPSARTGVYSDTEKYPWPKAAGARFGMVPVLIYDEGLVNSRFGVGDALRGYEHK